MIGQTMKTAPLRFPGDSTPIPIDQASEVFQQAPTEQREQQGQQYFVEAVDTPEEEPFDEPLEEDDKSRRGFMVGGVLALVVGVSAGYWLLRRKRKRR